MNIIKRLAIKYWRTIALLIIVFVMVFVLIIVKQIVKYPVHAIPETFVKRIGSELVLKGKPFRFSGANIYWLGLDENVDGVDYPTHFRVDDALETAQLMGATVVRAHTLGISVGCPRCIEPSPGTFNETALRYVDYAIMSARQHHLRLIIPLVDNFHYYHGGKYVFTQWRGLKDQNQFYSNSSVLEDFEDYINHLLNRVNSYTGVAYKNDPTILGWETGNGLVAPSSWVETIAAYIKSVDQNHLVIDGNSGQSYGSSMFAGDVQLPDVDIYTGQYYPMSVSALNAQAEKAQEANKVFIAEEYAWNNYGGGDSLDRFLTDIETNYAIAGDMFWSLFGHSDSFGYVPHPDGYTLHYPGDTPAMSVRAQELRTHAYTMAGLSVPDNRISGTPVITSTTPGLEWRGVAGAATYSIERSTQGPDGPWVVICRKCVTDNTTPWFQQEDPPGTKAWYRIQAFSMTGVASTYSPLYEI